VKVARPKVSQGSKAQGISGYLKGCHGIFERYLSRHPNYVFRMTHGIFERYIKASQGIVALRYLKVSQGISRHLMYI
jgi:hypothetical protein